MGIIVLLILIILPVILSLMNLLVAVLVMILPRVLLLILHMLVVLLVILHAFSSVILHAFAVTAAFVSTAAWSRWLVVARDEERLRIDKCYKNAGARPGEIRGGCDFLRPKMT